MPLPNAALSPAHRSRRWIAALGPVLRSRPALGSADARLRGLCGPKVALAMPGDEPRGQTIVEFALVVSFLFLILFGIVDFSRLFFAYATMANGVREGARYGVVHPDDDAGIVGHAQAMMVLIGDEASVTVDFPDSDEYGNSRCSHYCRVVVMATCDFDVWTPIIPAVEIRAQSTMHVE